MSRELIRMALQEDIGEGDVTSAYFIPEDRMARAFQNGAAPTSFIPVDK